MRLLLCALAAAVFLAVASGPAYSDHHNEGGEEAGHGGEDHAAGDHAAGDHSAGDHSGDVHGAHDLGHGNASDKIESPDEFRTDLALYTFAVFLALLAILSKVAWPKISDALLEREKHIEGQIAAAEAKHQEAKQLLAEHEAKLASAADEVRAMLEEARRDAESTKDQIVDEARAAADQERQRAVREVEIATDQAMKKLTESSANLAVELAGKVVRETITPEKQAALVRDALANLNSTSPSNN